MLLSRSASVASRRILVQSVTKAVVGRSIGSLAKNASSCRCCTIANSVPSPPNVRSYSNTSATLTPETTLASIEKSFPGAVTNTTLISQIQSKLSSHGYGRGNTLVATSLCADEVNRTLEADLSKAFDMPNFSMGGLAGFPFGGITAFGAMASHIPDGGHCLVVYGPHVGVDSTGAVGTVERQGRAAGGACCGSAVAAAGYVADIHLGASAKYGPSLDKLDQAVCRRAFHTIDGNQDGRVDKVELMMLFAMLDITLTGPEFDAVFAELDTSGDGHVSESEFATWFMRSKDNPQSGGGAAAASDVTTATYQSKLLVDPTDAQQQFVGNMLLPHAERLEQADSDGKKMTELPYALFDAQKGLIDHIVSAGAANVAGKGKIAVLGGIQINTPNEPADIAMEDYFLPLSMEVYDHRGNVIFDDDDHP